MNNFTKLIIHYEIIYTNILLFYFNCNKWF